jgi:ATP-binding cassette subfamily C (CFTR/MRP) protein 4
MHAGGQKARVALARAAYSGASVHLMDDPLSAVDPRVGQVLFDQCIGPTGLLKGESAVWHQLVC